MNKSINKIAAVLIFFLIVTSAQAQFRMSVGPATGFNFNLINGSDVESGGSGIGFLFSSQTDMTFNQDRSLGILFSMSFYDNRSGDFSVTYPGQGFNQTQDTDLSLSYFMFEPLFKFRLPVGVYFVFGPALGFNLSAERNVKYTNTYPNGQQQTGTGKETLKNTNTRFALATGAGYDIRLSNLITLAPQLTFRFGMTDIVENFSLKIMTFQAAVACKFHVL